MKTREFEPRLLTGRLWKRQTIFELSKRYGNCRTDQLTENPATERSRGSFVLRLVCKGFRVVRGEAFEARERGGRRRERPPRPPGRRIAESSQTLASEKACQLTSRLPSHPRSQRFHKTRPTLYVLQCAGSLRAQSVVLWEHAYRGTKRKSDTARGQ